jgi:glycosyltransferase involved in cell wall biosynthesis
MHIVVLAGDVEAPIARIRVLEPLQALAASRGDRLSAHPLHAAQDADVREADVLVIQRPLVARAWRLLRSARLAGAATVVEIDDLLTALPAHIPSRAAVQQGLRWLRASAAEADLVTVSTERLGTELRNDLGAALDPSALHVVGNAAHPRDDSLRSPIDPAAPATLLFASLDRIELGPVALALRALAPRTVRVVAVGPAGQALAQALEGSGLAVQAAPLMSRADFVRFAAALPNAVAVIPLAGSRFASCKSAIKWFEYAEAGIPVLCSDVPPYSDVIDDGRTGVLVADDPDAWRQALEHALGAPGWRAGLADAARARVRAEHGFDRMVAQWAVALQRAQERRRLAVVRPPTAGERLVSWWRRWTEAPLVRLRVANRARLERRRRKG